MSSRQNILDIKAFEEEMLEEERQGFPNFKYMMLDELVNKYNMDPLSAKELAFSEDMHEKITADVVWAQHMGPEYFAEVAHERANR